MTPTPAVRGSRRPQPFLTSPAAHGPVDLTLTPLSGLAWRTPAALVHSATTAPARTAPIRAGWYAPASLARSASTTRARATPTPPGGRAPAFPAQPATPARTTPSGVRGQEVAASFPEAAPTPVPTAPDPGDTRTTAEAKA